MDDPHVRCPDITKARQLLGWEPLVSIDDGLRQTIEYFREAESAREPSPAGQTNFTAGNEAGRIPVDTR